MEVFDKNELIINYGHNYNQKIYGVNSIKNLIVWYNKNEKLFIQDINKIADSESRDLVYLIFI
jgi:hypothetical protein